MPLHVSINKCSSSGGRTFIKTSSGVTHSGWWLSDVPVKGKMMYWYKFVLLMMSTCCLKHVQAWNKCIEKECVKLVINQNYVEMHGRQNINNIYIYIWKQWRRALRVIKFKLKGPEGSNDVIFSTVQLRNIFHSLVLQKYKMCIKVRESTGSSFICFKSWGEGTYALGPLFIFRFSLHQYTTDRRN
jgi:hypothetical protein